MKLFSQAKVQFRNEIIIRISSFIKLDFLTAWNWNENSEKNEKNPFLLYKLYKHERIISKHLEVK